MNAPTEHHYALVALGIALIVIGLWIFISPLLQQSFTLSSASSSLSLATTSMQLTSSAFVHNGTIPRSYTCQGLNVSPPLLFGAVPSSTKSIAFIMDDPDAPQGTWTHWLWWNAQPSLQTLPQNTLPLEAVQGTTSAGSVGYHGPCPPAGTHRYVFHAYALDTLLTLSSSTTAPLLRSAMQGHILAQGQLIGLYSQR